MTHVSSYVKKLLNDKHRTITQTDLPLSSLTYIIQIFLTFPPLSGRIETFFNHPVAANKYFRLHPSLLIKGVPTLATYLLEALYVIVAYNKKNHLPAFQNAIIHTACLICPFFNTRPSQIHLHLHQRETTYT